MEFLDPKKQKAHTIRLMIGYVLVGITLILATIVLLYSASGFGLKNGQVIQSGRVFISSRPAAADIFISGSKYKERSNTSMLIEAGQYTFELKRDGYRSWKRAINVEGGAVARFDYPVLFPSKLVSTTAKKYDTQPGSILQSPDRRWMLVQHSPSVTAFDMYDLDNPEKDSETVNVPSSLLTTFEGTAQRWELGEWSNDNRNILLKHISEKNGQDIASEYIVFDREEPGKSVNLTKVLGVNPSKITLRDKAYDEYYLYDQAAKQLSTASLKKPIPEVYLKDILAYKSYGKDVLLYATTESAAAGKTSIKLREGDLTYNIRQVAVSDTYLLDLTKYEDNWFAVAGVPSENRIPAYKNPASTLRAAPKKPLVPVYILKGDNPSYISFSENSRFIMAQSNNSFAVFDAENEKGYAYQIKTPMDVPQTHATWMDGHRLNMVSDGKVTIFEFDDANQETLVNANPAFGALYDRQYKYMYTVSQQTTKVADKDVTSTLLVRTALRTEKDL